MKKMNKKVEEPEKNSVVFTITLPKPVHDFLTEKGNALQMKRSAFIRHLLISYVEEEKKQDKGVM